MITEKLGGRKFLLAIIAIAVGTLIEIKGAHGLSANMAGLLAGVVGLFGAANAIVTSKAMSVAGEQSPGNEPTVTEIVDTTIIASIVEEQVAKAVKPLEESQIKLAETLSNVGVGVSNTNKLLRVAMGQSQPTE